MLDSSDIRNAVLELKKSILFVNRYEKAADAVAAIMGKSASLQSRPLLSDLPQDAAELALRKRELAELYGFVEQNYAQLMISGLLFPGDNESRQTFTTAYHALYLALREYIIHVTHGMEMLYVVEGWSDKPMWVWENDDDTFTTFWTSQHHADFDSTLFDMVKQEKDFLQTISRSATMARDAFTEFAVDYRNGSCGRGQQVLQEYKESWVREDF